MLIWCPCSWPDPRLLRVIFDLWFGHKTKEVKHDLGSAPLEILHYLLLIDVFRVLVDIFVKLYMVIEGVAENYIRILL